MSDIVSALAAALADRYTIARELGAGGMATVYLAHDLKHDRDVAIKVLHADLGAALGGERFLSEIRTTARLQHPHILPLLDSGDADGLLYYVMPLVTGETLRARLERERQLPVDDAVLIAREVADALGYAHGLGVIHRDIKPENILLQGGHALVADFGIALAVQQAGGARMTQTGLSLGTPQYMSPEQAMGERTIDARSDIYALGAVTYEMLVGEPPFTGPTVQAIVARLVTEEPRPISVQRKAVPETVEAAVLHALEKLPADRTSTAAEFAAELLGGRSFTTQHRRTAGTRLARVQTDMMRWAWVPALLLGAVAATWWARRNAQTPVSIAASILPPTGCTFAAVGTSNLVQLSPDGTQLAFVAQCGDTTSVWLRILATGEAHAVPGTTGAIYPFWSGDGRSLGFFAGDSLKRVDLATGAVRDLAPALNGRGGAWNRAGDIIYAPDLFGPLFHLPAGGGAPVALGNGPVSTTVTNRLPSFLPDGKHFVFARGTALVWQGVLMVGTLGSNTVHQILDSPSNVAYADGRLYYIRDGALLAQPLDASGSRFTGPAVSVVSSLEIWPFRYLGNYSAAGGLLVYRGALGLARRLDWFDPVTHASTPVLGPGAYASERLSPDGESILIDRPSHESTLVDAWLYHIPTQQWTRLTTQPGTYYSLAWSPDGSRIALQRSTDTAVHVLTLDHREVATYRTTLPTADVIQNWSPDGSYALGDRQVGGTGFDITRLDLTAAAPSAVPLIATPADESTPVISPNGRWLAYASALTGRSEVYLAALPGATSGRPASSNGALAATPDEGVDITWSRDGRTLYYVDATGHLMAVPIGAEGDIGRAVPVAGAPGGISSIDGAPGGKLLLLYDDHPEGVPITVQTGLRAALPH